MTEHAWSADAGRPAARPQGAAAPRWQVRLLGGVEACDGAQRIDRFPSRAVAALLARLALAPERTHAREELVELLWPGVALHIGRNRLRQVLSTLRSLLEPPAQTRRPVLLADRMCVRVVPGALGCDAREFERLLRAGRHAEARALYAGELLPGFYDDWIGDERARLAALFERCSGDGGAATVLPLPLTAVAATSPMPSVAPAPAALPDLARATIPHYLTRAFGADLQAARLRAEVVAHRLVTLVGPGGSGKTRLAVDLAHALYVDAVPGFGDGAAGPGFDLVAFVPLVGCRSAAEATDALLGALHLHASGGDAVQRIVHALADRHALFVLDNFEQLDGEAAALVAGLAARLPQFHQLITSRRALGLDGERTFRVATLELPPAGSPLDAAAASPAVALFVDRARAVRPDFHLGRTNAGAIAALVRALDGMPLAIELAASRVRSFAPAEMLARMQGAGHADGGSAAMPTLDLLALGRPRSGIDRRHASMQAVIEWSWQQLDEAQRSLLGALTVFAGGCSIEAAVSVCADGTHDVRLEIDELHGNSLLQLHESGGADAGGWPRIVLAEPVREFAAARLDAARAQVLRARHRLWWIGWAQGFGPTPPLGRVRQELPNIVAALGSALADQAPQDAVRIVLALRAAFNEVLLPAAGMKHLAAALERVDDASLLSLGHSFLGVLCFEAGEGAAAQRHVELGLAHAGTDAAIRARALHAAASVRWRATRDATGLLPMLDEAQALAERAGELGVGASVDALRAFIVNVVERDYARGEELHRSALAKWQRQGNLHAINGGAYTSPSVL